jgi:hypothetical protein
MIISRKIAKTQREKLTARSISVVPAGLGCMCAASGVRRLKSTVNQVPSLRDISPLIQLRPAEFAIRQDGSFHIQGKTTIIAPENRKYLIGIIHHFKIY